MNIEIFFRYFLFNLGFHKLNQKEYERIIQTDLEQGISRKDIFARLSVKTNEKDELAFLINSTATSAEKKRTKNANLLIFISLLLFFFMHLFQLYTTLYTKAFFLWLFLYSYVLFQLAAYKARAYFFIEVFCAFHLVIYFLQSSHFEKSIAIAIETIVFAIFLSAILVSAHRQKVRLYPDFSYSGPPKDAKGEFVFNDINKFVDKEHEKDASPNKIKNILIIVVMIVAVAFLPYSRQISNFFKNEDEDINQILVDMVNEYNQQLPLMLDNETEQVSVKAGINELTFYYRLVNLDTDFYEIDPEFLAFVKAEIMESYCNNYDSQIFIDNNIKLIYLYFDRNNKFVTEISIDSSACH